MAPNPKRREKIKGMQQQYKSGNLPPLPPNAPPKVKSAYEQFQSGGIPKMPTYTPGSHPAPGGGSGGTANPRPWRGVRNPTQAQLTEWLAGAGLTQDQAIARLQANRKKKKKDGGGTTGGDTTDTTDTTDTSTTTKKPKKPGGKRGPTTYKPM